MNRITQAIVVDMKDQVGGLDELPESSIRQ